MKRFAFILAIVLLIAGCGSPQVAEAPEYPQESYTLDHSLDEVEVPDEIAIPAPDEITIRVPVEIARDVRPHHYGSFDRVPLPHSHGIPMFYETTFTGLEARAPNIVRGRMGDDARVLLTQQQPGGVNIVSLEILEVIKGEQIRVGETIRIIEPYSIFDGALHTSSGYLPSTPHQEYFFFLHYQHQHISPGRDRDRLEEMEGAFWTLHGVRSRFLVPINRAQGQSFCVYMPRFSRNELGLGDNANIEIYMSIWQDVLDAYMS